MNLILVSFSLFRHLCIVQFDQEIRSRNIDPESPTFRLITDGQLPLRQCLHPEACAKDIELPNYFCKFSDLRKEYVRFKSGDLSRALVAIKDVPNMPALPAQPTCIADMIAGNKSIKLSVIIIIAWHAMRVVLFCWTQSHKLSHLKRDK